LSSSEGGKNDNTHTEGRRVKEKRENTAEKTKKEQSTRGCSGKLISLWLVQERGSQREEGSRGRKRAEELEERDRLQRG